MLPRSTRGRWPAAQILFFMVTSLVSLLLVYIWLPTFWLPGRSRSKYNVPTFSCFSVSLIMTVVTSLPRLFLSVSSASRFDNASNAWCSIPAR